jgi:NADPH:quinone reductase-like Zn-dependent oxidoreductase
MGKALICQSAGEWPKVLRLQDVALPPSPLPGFVRIKMLAAAVHPSDFGMMAGTYGKAKEFPCVMGREGVGEVAATGDIVRIPEFVGAWQEEIDVPADGLVVCPKDLKPETLALSFINPPTALRILEDFSSLSPGDAVITNAGKSAVSQAFLQLAREMGLKPYAVVRGKTFEDEKWLQSLGAEGVFDEGEEYFKKANVRLALNQVGGESVLRLIKSLGEGGVCVTIGGAVKESIRYPTRELIFKDVQLRGFWMDKWLRENSSKTRGMMEKIWALMRAGKLTQEISGRYPLENFKEALGKAQESGRRGKVVLLGGLA